MNDQAEQIEEGRTYTVSIFGSIYSVKTNADFNQLKEYLGNIISFDPELFSRLDPLLSHVVGEIVLVYDSGIEVSVTKTRPIDLCIQ